ncbi:MAG: hypothetical protein LBD90_07415 [Bifidobacteriaceae bacterium]|jgi:hypothetical protein|nr:hypothetical protein [Bifidobacteriaceae bacterium]
MTRGHLREWRAAADGRIAVVYGRGAALVGWQDAPVVLAQLPKNEIQFRAGRPRRANRLRVAAEPGSLGRDD